MNQKSLETWKQRIAERKTSGLNVTDWCEKNNLSKNAYYYWLKRIETTKQNTDTIMPVFVEIESTFTTPSQTTGSDLKITWNDINITISNSDNARLAAEFIFELQKLC
ncbi:IS66 family insertion sequence element accessory protein TnpA [Ruminiclostridium cellobioparum]|uniref:IS66 family insertion sequence element accessory protein TnpA n=1 Tax=Ruminiclostridium cellobioparum TaxID=29355 RepID=UPI0028A8BFB3|nr:hypothetical protein [Ruminiclostridium cellobioparum]